MDYEGKTRFAQLHSETQAQEKRRRKSLGSQASSIKCLLSKNGRLSELCRPSFKAREWDSFPVRL